MYCNGDLLDLGRDWHLLQIWWRFYSPSDLLVLSWVNTQECSL